MKLKYILNAILFVLALSFLSMCIFKTTELSLKCMQFAVSISCIGAIIIRKTKCFDFWERNVLFPKTKRSFFRTPKHPLPCPFPLNFSLLIITKKFGNLAKNRYICIV